MIYTLQEGQSFDAEILRQELVKAIGPNGWNLQTAGNSVEFRTDNGMSEQDSPFMLVVRNSILAHFSNSATRDHNKAILKQIADLEATQTPRRVREGGTWLADLDSKIAVLRKELK